MTEDEYPARMTIEQIATVGGSAIRRLIDIAGVPTDAYILITVRNTPEIDAGSDQVLATNVGDIQNLLEILKWHVGVTEERITKATKVER